MNLAIRIGRLAFRLGASFDILGPEPAPSSSESRGPSEVPTPSEEKPRPVVGFQKNPAPSSQAEVR